MPVLARILVGELPLPNVALVLSLWQKLVTPRIALLVEPSASRFFPFSFGGECFACPLGIGGRIIPTDVNHRMVSKFSDVRARTSRFAPVRLFDLRPPMHSDHCPEALAFALGLGDLPHENDGPPECFSLGQVSGFLDEGFEFRVGHAATIDPILVQFEFPDWAFAVACPAFRTLRAHPERAGRDPGHVLGGGFLRARLCLRLNGWNGNLRAFRMRRRGATGLTVHPV